MWPFADGANRAVRLCGLYSAGIAEAGNGLSHFDEA